jgi:acyl-CoA thioesterase I
MTASRLFCTILLALACTALPAQAEQPWTFSNNTRYLAIGDSLAAGYGAIPATQGYAYLLYQGGAYDKITNTIFANAAVPGATSADVLAFQVPQAAFFQPHVVTISVGGNDLLRILGGADPTTTLIQFQANLAQILGGLRQAAPNARIYVSNLYDIPEITVYVPGGLQAILQFNAIVAGVAQAYGARVADIFRAFDGRTGLLLVERNGASQFEVHPTNAGYRVMANAFQEAGTQ